MAQMRKDALHQARLRQARRRDRRRACPRRTAWRGRGGRPATMLAHVVERPDGERIVGGDEAERAGAGALEPPGEQHAEGLMGEAALERIADEVDAACRAGRSRPGPHSGLGTTEKCACRRSQSETWSGSRFQVSGSAKSLRTPLGEIGRERELAAVIGRAPWGRSRAARVTTASSSRMPSKREHLAGEHEGVARGQLLDEIFLDLAEHAGRPRARRPLSARRARGSSAPRRWCRHSAGIAARCGDGRCDRGLRGLLQLGIALVIGERVAAGRDEFDDLVEGLARQVAIGGGAHAPRGRAGRRSKGAAQAMPSMCWASTSSAPGREGGVSCAPSSVASSAAWHSSTSKRLAGTRIALLGSSMPVIGAADALGETARALRRADIDDEIDIAPVDAEIEGRGADHGAELARDHRRLDLAPLRHVERAVMQRDGQVVVVVGARAPGTASRPGSAC